MLVRCYWWGVIWTFLFSFTDEMKDLKQRDKEEYNRMLGAMRQRSHYRTKLLVRGAHEVHKMHSRERWAPIKHCKLTSVVTKNEPLNSLRHFHNLFWTDKIDGLKITHHPGLLFGLKAIIYIPVNYNPFFRMKEMRKRLKECNIKSLKTATPEQMEKYNSLKEKRFVCKQLS